jgi:hypothetical protein
LLRDSLDFRQLFALTERPMIEALLATAKKSAAADLLSGIFGERRQLYKRLVQYSYFEEPDTYRRLARRPYAELCQAAEAIAANLSAALRQQVAPHEVLVDAPPTELEVDFNVEVFFSKERVYRPLGAISPVVRTLAREQFDDYVKRVRIFIHPRLADEARRLPKLTKHLADSIGS